MPEEKSIKNQIAAMEGWAIDAKTKVDANNYDDTNKDLKEINLQGRRLEWRGGRYGLKHLPDLDEVKQLKKKITATRAAAQTALSSITKLRKLPKPEGKTPAEAAAIRKKESSSKKDAGKNISILIQGLKEARAIADAEPWMNLDFISKNKKALETFLRGEGYYKDLGSERIKLWNGWWKPNKISLVGIILEGADLTGANLVGAGLLRANLYEANLTGANLRGAVLDGADLTEANLSAADLRGADLRDAVLRKVKGLTREQLRLARNWEKAYHIPRELR